MSRALDKHVVASLSSGNSHSAYQAICGLFTSRSNESLLELEILGRSHPFPEGCCVLKDGCAVAVSKLALVQAFLVGRQILRAHIDRSAPRKDDELLAATAVMLLMDPEHLTAANTRKRVIQGRILSMGAPDLRISFEAEKHFLDSLLTSRLHRHTKSPTLWAHLQWLLGAFTLAGIPINGLSDITKVVFIAAERHPRNYYAWSHARFLARTGLVVPLEDVLRPVTKWCSQHHTDTSGWSFLYFLLSRIESFNPAGSRLVLEEAVTLVLSLRLSNESIWVFLRTLAASRLVEDEDYSKFISTARSFIETVKLPADHGVLHSALDWCETYRAKTPSTDAGVTQKDP